MTNETDTKPERLSKQEKQERKKLESAAKRMKEKVKEKTYLKSCVFSVGLIDFLIFLGISFITTSILTLALVFGYVIFITLIAFVPFMIQEYEQVGRRPPALVRGFNSFLIKVFPVDRTTMRLGPSILLSFIYLVTIGGFIAIGFLTFADFLSGNPLIYNYLIENTPPGEYGYFSFVSNSTQNSLIPSLLWYLIIFIPVIFCILFLVSAIYYRNNLPTKINIAVIASPVVVLLPLFLTAQSPYPLDLFAGLQINLPPSLVVGFIFLIGWLATILIWSRHFTKRNAFICFAIFFTQVLASFLIIYSFIFYEVRYSSGPPDIDLTSYYNLLFLLLWLGVLIAIPLLIKIFDYLFSNNKIKIIGILFAVFLAVTFQYFFFPLFSNSIYNAYPSTPDAAQIYVGFGFFYFYILLLLIPLFFIFGYFQIGFVRSTYRIIRDYGQKTHHPNAFRAFAGIIAILFIFVLIIIYYFVLYTPEDYKSMYISLSSLYNGELIYFLTHSSAFPIDPGAWKEIFQVSSLSITIGLLFYSSYRGAYNLALFADQIEDPEKNIKRFGLFNFIIFTSPRSYKSRVLFGLSLIFVFLGITTIFAFLKIHTTLFASEFTIVPNPSLIIFNTFDGIKLGISFIGMFVAIVIFFYFLYQRRKIASRI
ncbi:MAG: hypothetical protein ACTSRS_12610 [Candidatus Helarchaeota archaeon]